MADIKTALQYYNAQAGATDFPKQEGVRISQIESILDLNKDAEPFVQQGPCGRSKLFTQDTYEPLQFVHFSDIHAQHELWDRMVEYINHYRNDIAFALHTGDYCGGDSRAWYDFYNKCTPCARPILNCVGNHDTITDQTTKALVEKSEVHAKLFNRTENWDVTFMDGASSMTYYKDFPGNQIRLIVLDLYYDREIQQPWLKERLAEAKESGLSVITAMHENSADPCDPVDTAFQTLTDWYAIEGAKVTTCFEDIIADFIDNGGQYICNLCGHRHSDWFAYTKRGVLNIAVGSATDWAAWGDGFRTRGTRHYDCFNVMSVDVTLGILKLVRIGNICDHYLRSKRTLCYDYRNKKVISHT